MSEDTLPPAETPPRRPKRPKKEYPRDAELDALTKTLQNWISCNVRRLARERFLLHRDIAKVTGWHRTTVTHFMSRNWRNCKATRHMFSAISGFCRLARLFNVCPTDLFTRPIDMSELYTDARTMAAREKRRQIALFRDRKRTLTDRQKAMVELKRSLGFLDNE